MKKITLLHLLAFTLLILISSNKLHAQVLSESFESGLPTAYTTTTSYTLGSGTWTGQASGVIRGTAGIKTGTYSLQLRSQTGAQITSPSISGGVSTVTFWGSGSTTSSSVQVNYSTDGGTTWNTATGSPFAVTTGSAVQKTATINSSATSILIQFYRTAGTVYIDDVVVTGYSSATPAATPTFSLAAGTYTSAQSVTLSSTTTGAKIYYTTNGVDPTSASTLYTGAINVAATTTVKAIAYDSSNANPSSVATATYTINLPSAAATPTFNPVGGTYSSAQSVALSSTTSGAKIYYTLDGSAPTSASTLYTTALNIASTTTVKAIAYDSSNANPSSVATATYTISIPTITVTETSIPAMTAYVGETDSETIHASGSSLTDNISISITGTDAAMFSVSPTSITQTGGVAANTLVTITYTPTAPGTHTATLQLISTGATTVTRTLTGTSSYTPLSTPNATSATGVSNTGFTANWDAVSGATSYTLNVYTQGGSSTTTVLSENFTNFSAGTLAAPNNTDISTTLDTYTQTTGWTGVKVYQAAGTAKMGSSTTLGSITTPSLDLTGSNVSLSFKAMGWNADATTMVVRLDGTSIATPTIVSDQATWTTITLPITGGTATSKITFEGAQAAKGRFFLDDVTITKGGTSITPVSGSPFTVTSATSKTITGLSSGVTYYYDLTASNTNVTSALSNTITVTTGSGTGLSNNKIENISVGNGKVRFDAQAGENIEIYNSLGQRIIKQTATEGQNIVDLSNVKGLVIVKVANKTAKVIL